jgi:vacuolar-type H+-ATPase subunit E/Vma4
MPISDPDSFVEFVGQQTGDTLRLVLFCTPDDYRTAYVRDDVQDAYSNPEVDGLVAYLRELTDPALPTSIKDTTGDLESIVLTYDDAVGVVLPVADGNVLVSLDPSAASQLHDFTVSCQEYLAEM